MCLSKYIRMGWGDFVRIKYWDFRVLIIIVFMFLTALDGIVIPLFISKLIEAIEQKKASLIIWTFVIGFCGYFVIRTALYFWNREQQGLIKDFNFTHKSRLIRAYFSGDNGKYQSKVLSFLLNDFMFLENNYIKSFLSLIYCSTDLHTVCNFVIVYCI